MASALCTFLAISTLAVLTLADDADVTTPKKKKVEALWWYFSPLTALIIVKFKLLLIAFLVLTGTASITRFIGGLIHILASSCKKKETQPVYIKYESPSHHHSFEKPYYTEKDYYQHRSKRAVERAIRRIEGSRK